MSINVILIQVSPPTLNFVLANPAYLDYLLDYQFERQDSAFQEEAPELAAILTENDLIKPVETDKAWGGILYLLLLNALPKVKGIALGAAVTGLKVLRPAKYEEDIIRYLTATEVRILAPALAEITKDQFSANFDPQTMNGQKVYPVWWGEVEPDEEKEYLWKGFTGVPDYYQDAAQRGNGMIIFKS